MSLTRANVAYNLEISPHRLTMEYRGGERIEYVFSSDLYRRKFLEKHESNRTEIRESLKRRFGVEVSADLLADFRLYTNIEKRGFLLRKGGEDIKWVERVILNGETLTKKS